jgi:urease accessory protein
LLPILLTSSAFLPATAFAHPGHGTSNLAEGFLHPLSGLDHLLAMLAVGLWAAQMGGRARLTVPASFVLAMTAGWFLGSSGTRIPWVEQGIAASVLVMGLMIAIAARPPLALPITMAATFAMFHGHAHGIEQPQNGGWGGYLAGFTGATVLLHAAGIGISQILAAAPRTRPLLRLAGGGIALAGVLVALR